MFVVEASEKIGVHGFFSFCVVHERRRIGLAVWPGGNVTTPPLELHGPPDLPRSAGPGSSGNRATLMAIRRASSCVSIFACRAQA
jgi:hypothetical protein